MLAKKLASIALSALLVATLFPGLAFANALTPSSVNTQSSKSSTKTVYILTSSKCKAYKESGSFTYSGGLLKSQTTKSSLGGLSKWVRTWTYDKNKNITGTRASGSSSEKLVFKLNKKGQPISSTSVSPIWKQVSTIKYKSGKVASIKCVDYSISGKKQKKRDTRIFHCTYKNGRLVKQKMRKYENHYAYDAKGNLSKSGGSAYKNTYDSRGLLVKRDMGDGVTYAYTYKAVKVKSSNVAKVKAQQWALLNWDNNFALGTSFNFNVGISV